MGVRVHGTRAARRGAYQLSYQRYWDGVTNLTESLNRLNCAAGMVIAFDEVAEGEVRIMGSKSRLLQTLVAGSGVNSVPTQGLKWRSGRDPRLTFSGP